MGGEGTLTMTMLVDWDLCGQKVFPLAGLVLMSSGHRNKGNIIVY